MSARPPGSDAELKKSLAVINRLERELEVARRDGNEPIAIVGMACRFPGGANDPEAYWRLLESGREGRRMAPSDRWISDPSQVGHFLETPIDGLDDRIFRLSHEEIRSLDPQQRLLLELTWEAFEDAGIPLSAAAGSRTSVFVGIEKCDYAKVHLTSGDAGRIGAYSATGIASSTAAGRLSYMFDFHGPCLSLDSACASSLVSIDLACQTLRRGSADMAVSAAVSLMIGDEPFIALSKMGALSSDGRCKTFDAAADGYARGEGGAVLVLERLSDAIRRCDRVLALIRGVAVHHGGRSNGLTAPSVRSQVAVIEAAQREAGIAASDVAYVEAHGTGTSLGDPIEMAAIAEVFGRSHTKARPLRVGSVKTNIGHLETAAGMAGVIKVVLSLRNEILPPHLHLREPSAHIPWETNPVEITTALTPWHRGEKPRIAGVSAFGFNGTVAHAILSEAPAVAERTAAGERPLHVLTLSCRDDSALGDAARAFASIADDASIADVCYTSNVGRDHFEHRAAVVVGSVNELRESLSNPITGQTGAANKIAFMFAGQGSQYAGMGRALYEAQPVFRKTIDDCAELLRPHLDVPLADLLYGASSDRIDQTCYSQPALFALEYALCELWRSWGIRPAAVLGHSVGEYVAACVAGVFTLPDALRLIAARGRLVQTHSPSGRMAVLFAGAKQIESLMNGHRARVSLAALNAPENTVVSGESGAVQQLLDAAAAAGVKSRPLAVSHAFHSRLMEPVIAPFRDVISSMRLSRAVLPLISNRTGSMALPDELSHADAWCEHFVTPVLFSRSVRTLEESGFDVVVEIGPTAALSSLGPQSVAQSGQILWTPSLRKGGDDWRSMLTSLAQLHVRGVAVDWDAFDAPYGRRKISIPTYPFQRKRFWMDAPTVGAAVQLRSPLHRDVTETFEAVRSLGRKLLARAMRRIGALELLDQEASTVALRERLGILPEYARLFDWLLRVLPGTNSMDREECDVDALAGRVAADHPDLASVVRLLSVCLDAYPDVLRGKKKAVEVLFPGGSTAMLEAVYQNGRITEQFNGLIARSVCEAVRGIAAPVSILEIGAGTGGASKGVLEALLTCGSAVTYDYTDISAAFTRQAEERWASRFPFARFRVLDIEKDSEAQRFEPEHYDVIVASNVLHATRSMSRTIANTARLLKPGGVLILNEVTQLHEFLGMTFGLTPGWWLYEDDDLRTDHSPVLSTAAWKQALAREGLSMLRVLGLDGDDPENPLQAVMVARRDAVVKTTQRPAHRDDIAGQLTAAIRRISGIEIAARDRGANLFELGLDSLILMQVKQAVEQQFGVEVSMGQFYEETSTVELLADYIGQRTAVPETVAVERPVAVEKPFEPEETQPSGLEAILNRQLDIMARQLEVLKAHGASSAKLPIAKPAANPAPPPPSYAPHQENLTAPQRRFLEGLIRRYNARTPKSKELMARSRTFLADWIATIGFQQELKEMIYPIVSARSDGSAMWDVDGNRYVDLAMGFGVDFLGHQPPFVKEAIRAQLEEGFELATQSDLAAETARLVCELTGCERVAFSNTGTEAVMTAFRLARTVTRKSRIVYFKGSFHGSYDGVLAYAAADGPTPAARGILQHQVDDVLVLEYGAEESLRIIEAEAATIAGVLVEPVQSRNPDLQPRQFLHDLRRITTEQRIALIFDEMITGFRVHPGGAQAHFEVTADLVTYGKILGAGMPISAIAGKSEYLDALDGGAWSYGDGSRPSATTTFFGGTYCKHPLALAAARAGLRFMKEQGPELQASLNRRTSAFAARLTDVFREESVPLRVAWFSSQFQLRVATRTGETFQSFELALLFFLLLEKGIYTWERRICFLSVAHTEEDLERVVVAMRESLREMKAAGFFGHAAAEVAAASQSTVPLTVPLTDGQKELWFLASQSDAASTAYSEPLVLELIGPLDRAKLKDALNAVVARHEILRTLKVDHEALHVAAHVDIELGVQPLAGREEQTWLRAESSRPFDLARGPLVRASLLEIGPESHRLLLVVHHIIADGWSIGVFVDEMARIYSGLPVPPAVPFSDYVAWSRARRGNEADSTFWRERLSVPLRTLDLPADFPRPPRRGNRGSRIRVSLPQPSAAALKAFCREQHASLFMVLLAGYEVFLHRVARMNEIVVGIPSSGHAAMGVESMIGQCAGMLPLAAHVENAATFASLLRALKQDLLKVYEHQDLRPDELRMPELRAAFNQDRVPSQIAFAGLEARVLPSEISFVKYDLNLNAMEVGGEILLDFDYDSELFERATVEGWAAAFVELLGSCVERPEAPVRELGLSDCRVVDWPVDEELWVGGTHRVRPNQIEGILETHPRVERALVELREDCALVARIAGDACDAAELRRFMSRRVPPYLVPAAFSFSGDFSSAPVWDSGTPREPGDATEAALLAIFRDVLKIAVAGVHDDFFLLGGQSIQAVQIVMRIWTAFGVRLALNEVFTYRTVASLARRVALADATGADPIPVTSPAELHEASHAQRRLWFLGQVDGQEATYNLPGAYRFDEHVDRDALRGAFRDLIRRHEILRTTFLRGSDGLHQRIHDEIDFDLTFDLIDERIDDADVEAAVRERIEQEAARSFDLERGPLLFARLMRFGVCDVLVYNIHHIICVGWSQTVMVRELAAAYEQIRRGEAPSLPPPRIQYRDYVSWHRETLDGEAAKRSRAFWTQRLSGDITRLELPADVPRPAVQSTRGRRLRFRIDGETTNALRAMANDRGCTLFIVCVALVKTLLHRYTGAEEIVIGTPVAGREHPDLEGQIGCYVNTLVLRDRISGEATFVEILDQVRETILEAFEHQDYPFDLLIDDLAVPRDLRRSPLFDVLVTMQNNEQAPFVLSGREGRPVESDFTVTAFDLSLDFVEERGEVAVLVEYNSDIFRADRIERLAGHFTKIARAVLVDRGPISDLDLLLDAEHGALASFNDTAIPVAAEKTLFELFEAQVVKTPDRIALVHEGHSLTYAQLRARASALGHELVSAHGVGCDRLVALLLPRSHWPVVGIFGVLAAGGAYVPLDPDQPPQRLRGIVNHCGCDVIVAHESTASLAREISGIEPVILRSADGDGFQRGVVRPSSPSDLAYVIYTSGTTGTPKGVAIEQRSVVNMIAWMEREIYAPLGDSLREAMLAPFVFDTSVQQIFGSLFRGNTLHIVSGEVRNDPRALGDYFRAHAIDIVEFTPSLLLHALKEGLDSDGWSMKQICVGAEVFPKQLADLFFARQSRRNVRLSNLYGPTECCANTTYHHITFDAPADSRPVPIGRPIGNMQIFICDEHLRPVPLGIVGELCVSGPGLARGYHGDAESTASRFVGTPFGRIYRTGDLGYWRADGEIELVGRNDEQAKIRGVRVDPIEIENRLLAHESISQAAVVVWPAGGGSELVAYFAGRGDTSVARLREHLREALPEAMVPAIFVELPDLPRTAGGKIDKRALPPPDDRLVRRSTPFQEPRDAVEAALLAVWREVLPVARIGVDDSFFEVGGNSLRAVQLCARIRDAMGVDIRLRDLFSRPTIAALAPLLREAKRAALPGIVPAAAAEHYPLSPGQKGLWLLDRMIGDRAVYNMAGALFLEGPVDAQRLEHALTSLLRRHESLRSSFVTIEGSPRQKVADGVSLPFTIEDLSGESDPIAEARRRALGDASRPFDLGVAPLWRARLFVLDAGRRRFLFFVNLHHIISDGWSVDLFVRELAAAYRGELDPSPLPIQYRDYAAWYEKYLSTETAHDDRRYWLDKFSGQVPRVELPADRPRPAAKSHRGATIHRALDPELSRRLQELASSLGVTQFPLLLSLATIVISRYSGQDEVILGTAVAGRKHTELENQIGFYVDTQALRERIDPSEPFRALVARAGANVADALDHAAYPFDLIVEDLRIARNAQRTPLFDVVVTLEDETPHPDFGDACVTAVEEVARGSHFDLFLSFVRRGRSELRIDLEYDSDLFDSWRIEQLAGHIETLAASVVADPDAAIRDLEMLTASERRQVIEVFNETAIDYPREQSVDGLFREQAERCPDRIAVVHGERSLTYRELDRMSDGIARRLIDEGGIEAEDLTGVQMDRSVEMVATLLGILKTGAAYVPIDPAYPQARINAMRAGLKTVIAEIGAPAATNGPVRRLPGGAPRQLAYVMYTSGSTG